MQHRTSALILHVLKQSQKTKHHFPFESQERQKNYRDTRQEIKKAKAITLGKVVRQSPKFHMRLSLMVINIIYRTTMICFIGVFSNQTKNIMQLATLP